MNQIREHFLLRYFWMFMALHVINCSIDLADPLPQSIAEDLSVNEMESIVEVVLEKALGLENAIVEADDYDDENGGLSVKKTITYYCQHSKLEYNLLRNMGFFKSCNNSLYKERKPIEISLGVISPPPKS